jgi:hypothetical protein
MEYVTQIRDCRIYQDCDGEYYVTREMLIHGEERMAVLVEAGLVVSDPVEEGV